jgi:Mrp family chromosome partitioning ATPase
VLLVTSLVPGGGSTFVATNIGAAIALDERKTALVVDCNVYDPGLHHLLPIEPDLGLVEYLENVTLEAKDVIYSTGVRRLRLLPAGTRQLPGSEFFTSSRMRRLMQELRARYRDRYVIIDSPALGASADARILAELCDYVMLVVPHGRVTADQIQSGIDAIGPEKLAGVIFNT